VPADQARLEIPLTRGPAHRTRTLRVPLRGTPLASRQSVRFQIGVDPGGLVVAAVHPEAALHLDAATRPKKGANSAVIRFRNRG